MFAFILLAVLITLSVALVLRSLRVPLPPGPKPLPFIGNLHQLPRVNLNPFQIYADWSRIYNSPVVYFHIFGRQFVMLNTMKAVNDLLEKRSAIYSTRPRWVMAGELVGRKNTSIVFQEYGPRLKETRQIMHGWMGQKAAVNCWPLQEQGSHKLLEMLIESPELFTSHMRTNAGSLVLKFTYGITTQAHEDPWIGLSEELIKITTKASQPGRWLVDSFPILRFIPSWVPGAEFKRWANGARKAALELVRLPFDKVKSEVAQGTAVPSWTSSHLHLEDGKVKGTHDDAILICAAGSVYAAGIDTVVSMLRNFVLMMVHHPEVQRKAQQEIDAVLGNRLATMTDRDALPYVNAMIKEVLRINAVVPLAPHSLDDDDIYEGVRIPKGALVMANLWAISHDPETYKDPDTFRPERFLGDEPELDPTGYSFGYGLGRRFCPGYYFASATMFLNVSHILAVFNISPPLDERGHEVVPPLAYNYGHTSAPSEFQCTIKPRSIEKVALVQDVIAAADAN